MLPSLWTSICQWRSSEARTSWVILGFNHPPSSFTYCELYTLFTLLSVASGSGTCPGISALLSDAREFRPIYPSPTPSLSTLYPTPNVFTHLHSFRPRHFLERVVDCQSGLVPNTVFRTIGESQHCHQGPNLLCLGAFRSTHKICI